NNEKQQLVAHYVKKYKGNIVKLNGDTFTATFEGPSKAVHCSIDLDEIYKSDRKKISIGIHIKECLVGNPICNETEDFAMFVLDESQPYEILLTQTAKNLLVGTRVRFTQHKTLFKVKNGSPLLLFSVTEKPKYNTAPLQNQTNILPQNDTFLNKVIKKIEDHMSNEHFGVDMLFKEIGVSERQLQRRLKIITNQSPSKLICSMRLHKAKELIINQHSTIAEIAFLAGFFNPSYFSKCFKKEFSVSPSELINY
ncbi:helix-turn-helix domain-containing protein, partial [Aquimarina agarivorans]|uniref:helix-turn-helix domain-containing protein n=1 Tax=Aquimarina agarivorans TaxID=980584 RepID=UPI000248EFDD